MTTTAQNILSTEELFALAPASELGYGARKPKLIDRKEAEARRDYGAIAEEAERMADVRRAAKARFSRKILDKVN